MTVRNSEQCEFVSLLPPENYCELAGLSATIFGQLQLYVRTLFRLQSCLLS